MIISSKIDRTAVKRVKFDEAKSNFAYWQTRSHEDRLLTLESIRKKYINQAYDTQPGFQRVYSIINSSFAPLFCNK